MQGLDRVRDFAGVGHKERDPVGFIAERLCADGVAWNGLCTGIISASIGRAIGENAIERRRFDDEENLNGWPSRYSASRSRETQIHRDGIRPSRTGEHRSLTDSRRVR